METNELQDKAQGWQGNAQKAAQDLQSKAQEKVSNFKETAEEWRRRAVEASRKAGEATDDYVRKNPWIMIASVAVASLLLGFLLRRSRNSFQRN